MTLLSSLFIILLTAPDQSAPVPRSSAPTVTLESIDAAPITGRLVSIDGDGVVNYRVGDRNEHASLDDLTRLDFGATDKDPASRLKGANATLFLADGGQFDAVLSAALDGDRGVRVDVGLPVPIDVPFTAVTAIRFGSSAQEPAEAELLQRVRAREAGRDLLIALRDGKPVVLPGTLERITSEAWTFRIGDKSQTAPLEKAYAIVLSRPLMDTGTMPAEVALISGGTLHGQIRSADADILKLDAGALGALDIPWSGVQAVTLRSGRIVYLSDLEPTGVVQRSFFDVSWPPRKDLNVTGGPLVLNGRRYERGLGVHAFTAMTWQINGDYEQFTAMIGIDESVSPRGRAIFRVRCDDKIAYESAPIGPGQSTLLKVDLTGVKSLTLECDPGDDLDISDHCDWAAAKLVRAKSAS